MGRAEKHTPVKLIVGMLSSFSHLFEQIQKVLENEFGLSDYESPVLPFDKTDHYEKEFGSHLKRRFYSFENLIEAERLVDIKLFTNHLEKEFSDRKGNRNINIDPGYLVPGKLVLATTKDHQHRIYLGKGIYAEVTLRFKKGSFCPWEWTYPDYETLEYIDIFNWIRELYLKQLLGQ